MPVQKEKKGRRAVRRGFYWRVAAVNLRKNKRAYLPYLLTCILTAAMFYMICSIAGNSALPKLKRGSAVMESILNMGAAVTGIFAVLFLFYTSSFLMKQRKKEFGLYNILGMGKNNLAVVLLCETVYIAAITLGAGLLLGILFDKLMYLALLRLLNMDVVLGFEISGKALLTTGILLGSIFLAIFLYSVFQVRLAKPAELLKGSDMGEKEPKGKWAAAVLGCICLGAGYYLAVTTKNPLDALTVFFAAVLLVIFGTFLLFGAGSIALLKLLRKNKKYYYKTRHFISVSSMMFRMKKNAAGLANICILSTMVLVLVSSTGSLYAGIREKAEKLYPRDIVLYTGDGSDAGREALRAYEQREIADKGYEMYNALEYGVISFETVREGQAFVSVEVDLMADPDKIAKIYAISLEDWNRGSGSSDTLERNEVLLYAGGEDWDGEELFLGERSFRVKKVLEKFLPNPNMEKTMFDSYCLVVSDQSLLEEIAEKEGTGLKGISMFDIADGKAAETAQLLKNTPEYIQIIYGMDFGEEGVEYLYNMYGGVLFIGIFLGSLFLMAAILIIYYKQISEGYEDQKRYEILQKVGMTRKEIKSTIHSQVLTVFFLPLLFSGLHMLFAFPAVRRIMMLAGFGDGNLYAVCTAACFLVFALLYGLVYSLTSRTYYHISVQGESF